MDVDGFVGWLNSHFPISFNKELLEDKSFEEAVALVLDRIKEAYSLKESAENQEALAPLEQYVIINAVDTHWQEHLTEMEDCGRVLACEAMVKKILWLNTREKRLPISRN